MENVDFESQTLSWPLICFYKGNTKKLKATRKHQEPINSFKCFVIFFSGSVTTFEILHCNTGLPKYYLKYYFTDFCWTWLSLGVNTYLDAHASLYLPVPVRLPVCLSVCLSQLSYIKTSMFGQRTGSLAKQETFFNNILYKKMIT